MENVIEVKFLGGSFEGSEYLTEGNVYVIIQENDIYEIEFFGIKDDDGDFLPLEESEMIYFEKLS